MDIVSAIAGFFKSLGIILGLIQQSHDEQVGAQIAVGAANQASAITLVAVAQAAAQKPSDTTVDSALSPGGVF